MISIRALGGRVVCTCVAALFLLSPAAGAQERTGEEIHAVAAMATVSAPATVGCVGGIVNDDGGFDGSLSLHGAGGSAVQHDAAMRFVGPGAGRRIDQICACWRRSATASTTLQHQFVIFRADGPSGQPGSIVATVNAQANGIGTDPTLFTYNLAPFNILTPANAFFVAVRWNAGTIVPGDPSSRADHALCFDADAPPTHPIFFKQSAGSTWTGASTLFPATPIRALGIRTELAPASGGGPTCAVGACVENDTTICLNGGRFEVKVDFDPPNDADTLTEPARAERLTADTGYFTFFDPNNVEAVIKVLAACPVNNHHWVFAGGLTNVFTEITVCDKANGVQKKYTNPQSTPFQPIQDTSAFATCP